MEYWTIPDAEPREQRKTALSSVPNLRYAELTLFHITDLGRLGHRTEYAEDAAPTPSISKALSENSSGAVDTSEFTYPEADYAEFPFAFMNKDAGAEGDFAEEANVPTYRKRVSSLANFYGPGADERRGKLSWIGLRNVRNTWTSSSE